MAGSAGSRKGQSTPPLFLSSSSRSFSFSVAPCFSVSFSLVFICFFLGLLACLPLFPFSYYFIRFTPFFGLFPSFSVIFVSLSLFIISFSLFLSFVFVFSFVFRVQPLAPSLSHIFVFDLFVFLSFTFLSLSFLFLVLFRFLFHAPFFSAIPACLEILITRMLQDYVNVDCRVDVFTRCC